MRTCIHVYMCLLNDASKLHLVTNTFFDQCFFHTSLPLPVLAISQTVVHTLSPTVSTFCLCAFLPCLSGTGTEIDVSFLWHYLLFDIHHIGKVYQLSVNIIMSYQLYLLLIFQFIFVVFNNFYYSCWFLVICFNYNAVFNFALFFKSCIPIHHILRSKCCGYQSCNKFLILFCTLLRNVRHVII